jgi:hypothetical protein
MKLRGFTKNSVFWDVALYSPLKVNRYFGWTYPLHLEGQQEVMQVASMKKFYACGEPERVTYSCSVSFSTQLYTVRNNITQDSHSGGGVEIGSTRHVGHWMAYCTCSGWLWWWRSWWNEDWQGKPKYSEKTCPSATLSNTNPTWPDPVSNPGRRGGKPVTNRLSYVAAWIIQDHWD